MDQTNPLAADGWPQPSVTLREKRKGVARVAGLVIAGNHIQHSTQFRL